MNGIGIELGRVPSPKVESNTKIRTTCDKSNTEDTILVEDLIKLDRSLSWKRMKVRKDDGYKTNVVSREYFEKSPNRFKWKFAI